MGQIDAISSIIHTRTGFRLCAEEELDQCTRETSIKNENEEDTHAALCFKSLVIRCSKPKQFNLGVNIPCLECFDFPTISVVFQ